ncbi:ABC transporter permease [Clostridium sp. 'White wine YQ']|uniref:ABC transporter permease n=1 Tax=Clostridium sp. 'White wine YQ' TaxID=3027474 RepID=UPI002365D143|nr:ABC transporter permease subunit [Clostridium sp. 'White wine YQ']MDD7794496.1 ABC transporter permease subunit [Clostridium sp. 'White wine YQ']
MNSLGANVINEVQKLFLRKKTVVFLVVMALISFLSAFFISVIQSKLFFISLTAENFPLIILSVITNVFLPLFIFMLAAELFSGEIADRTMKLTLTRPIGRFKIFISKNIAIAAYVILNLFVIMISTLIAAVLFRFSIGSYGLIVISYMLDAIPALIVVTFASCIVQFFRSSIGSLVSCILLFIGVKIVAIFINGFNNAIFTSYLNWYTQWTSGGIKYLAHINLLFMLIAYGIIFFTIGFYLFDKKEF